MTNVSGLTRGDKNRNRRLARLRELVRSDYAIVALDLGEDTHMAGVYDHDSRALARQKLSGVKAFELGPVLDWAADAAEQAGFVGIMVSCEPTGARWMQVGQLAADRGVPFVCVQPLATHRAREGDDYTLDKSDYRDTTLIASVTARLQCYVPEAADEQWAQLRHQGYRRAQLTERAQAAALQAADLLALAWPAVLDTAATTFDAVNWVASVAVVVDRCDGDPAAVKKMGRARFTQAVRRELPRWGGKNIYRRIIDAVYDALTNTDGAVIAQRKGALQRAGWAIDDLRSARGELAVVDKAMITGLDELGVSALLATIPGLSAATAAHILAETG